MRISLNQFRHAISTSIAVLLACIVTFFTTANHTYWLILTAFLVCQTTIGTAIRQGIMILMSIVITLFLAQFIQSSLPSHAIFIVIALSFILCGAVLIFTQIYTNIIRFILILFPFILMLNLLPIQSHFSLQNNLFAIVMGGVIGIICSQIFPTPIEKIFRQLLVSVLENIISYTDVLTHSLFHQDAITAVLEKKYSLEKSLLSTYPNWVYDVGFNRGLRSSYRYFLIHLEYVIDSLFAINQLIRTPLPVDQIRELKAPLLDVTQRNQELLKSLLLYFQGQPLTTAEFDYTTDIVELENALKKYIPPDWTLFEGDLKRMSLPVFVRELKDIRQLLLKLLNALPQIQPK